MAALIAFTPSGSSTTTIAPSAATNINILGVGHYLRIVNQGPGLCWIAFYDTSLPTVTQANSMVLLPNAVEIFNVPTDTTLVRALADASGTTLNVTRGEGQ